MRLVRLNLENICGFRRATFEFDPHLNLLYGPNGCGKSSLLNIVSIMTSPQRYAGRDFSMLFRKMIHHEDYDPTYTSFSWEGFSGIMRATADFEVSGETKQVVLEVDPKIAQEIEKKAQSTDSAGYLELCDKIGIVKNELPISQISHSFFADADNPSNMAKFQLNAEVASRFLDIVESVYGYECGLEKNIKDKDKKTGEVVDFYTDFIIIKNDDGQPVRVHYRRMSDGERKIATLFKQMVSPSQYNEYDVFLIDNLELHCYFRRHKLMIDKIRQHFANKQIIATTHSAVLVGCDTIPPYVPEDNLIDVVKVRKSAS